MTYSNSFGQQPRRRPSYGSYSAMSQQQPQTSSGNWQSAMAGGQQAIRPYGIQGQGQSNAAAMQRQYQQQGARGYPRPYGIAPSQPASSGGGVYTDMPVPKQYRGEQRGYMPDPGSGYRPGQGGGYGGSQQAGPVYDPNNYRRLNPTSGNMATITGPEQDRYARLYGYNVEGSPTYDRQRFEAEQLGRINGADTLQGRAQTLTERLGLGQLGISERQQALREMVETGQLSIEQARQALAERSNEQQYGLQGRAQSLAELQNSQRYGLDTQRLGLDTRLGMGNLGVSQGRLGLDTELGRGGLDLQRLQNAQDWQYKMAQTAANPASAATMAALSGNAPWLRPQQPQIAAAPGSPLSSAQTGVLSGREMNYNTYGRLNPSEQAAYGSYARAAYGVEPGDLEQQMRQYAPGQGSGMQTARWR